LGGSQYLGQMVRSVSFWPVGDLGHFEPLREHHRRLSLEPVAAKGNVVIPNAVNPSRIIADFVTGFDLQHAPPLVIDRARVAFVDTVGVMLAGSQLPPADTSRAD